MVPLIKQLVMFPIILMLGLGLAVIAAGKALAETAASDVKATEEKNEPGAEAKTWVFVMTLCFSRHMYAEIVTDQKVGT